MTRKILPTVIFAALYTSLLCACSAGDDYAGGTEETNAIAIEDKLIAGVSEKGPFVKGSDVTIQELDTASFAQTGKSFTASIASDLGEYNVRVKNLFSPYILVRANGYYKNEITGKISKSPISMNALSNIKDREKVNVNLMTHLEYQRAMHLITENGETFGQAKEQAKKEILSAFHFGKQEAEYSEELSIFGSGSGDAMLLAISILLQGNLSEGDLSVRLASIAVDIKDDGLWDDARERASIADGIHAMSLSAIRNNVASWENGDVADFETYVKTFWHTEYGLGDCTDKNADQVKPDTNSLSAYHDSLFVCVDSDWRQVQTTADTVIGGCWESREGETRSIGADWYICRRGIGWDLFGANEVDDFRYYLNPELAYDSIVDSRDGQVYKTIRIGERTWFANNLNYASEGGNADDGVSSWCYNDDSLRCKRVGRIYTWAAAMNIDSTYNINTPLETKAQGLCPDGFRIATVADVSSLMEANFDTNAIASKYYSSIATNASGLSLMPAPNRNDRGIFSSLNDNGEHSFIWLADEKSATRANFWYYGIYGGGNPVGGAISEIQDALKTNGFAVRCVKDE